jgi:nicotinamidase-related amidase
VLGWLLAEARSSRLPVIFACDSFLEQDFIFRGRMKPHSIRGTAGAAVVADLAPEAGDVVLQKRRFSAFFKTDLDQTLRTLGCDAIAVTGIATNVCVLATVLDGLSHDFEVVWLRDCCAAHRPEVHEATLALYAHFPLEPLLRITTARELVDSL